MASLWGASRLTVSRCHPAAVSRPETRRWSFARSWRCWRLPLQWDINERVIDKEALGKQYSIENERHYTRHAGLRHKLKGNPFSERVASARTGLSVELKGKSFDDSVIRLLRNMTSIKRRQSRPLAANRCYCPTSVIRKSLQWKRLQTVEEEHRWFLGD